MNNIFFLFIFSILFFPLPAGEPAPRPAAQRPHRHLHGGRRQLAGGVRPAVEVVGGPDVCQGGEEGQQGDMAEEALRDAAAG